MDQWPIKGNFKESMKEKSMDIITEVHNSHFQLAGRNAQRHNSSKKNLELEAKVEKLQKELDECTSFMLQLKFDVHEVSAHHIV